MKKTAVILFLVAGFVPEAYACDPCALYSASRLQGHSKGSTTVSVSEQFSSYNKADSLASNSIKDGELVKGYSTTQFSVGYDLTQNAGVQLTVPVISRNFDRIEDFRSREDSETGVGDIALTGSYSVATYREDEWTIVAGVTGGVKFPTGDTGTLERLFSEDEHSVRNLFRHHTIGASAGGRALSLGSGSYDYIFGADLLSRYNRIFFLSDIQYTLRTEGDFNYEFADDLLWSVGPGYYLMLNHEYTVAARVAVAGEYKGKDSLDGSIVSGSQISNVFVGPEVLVTIDDQIGMQLGTDFRVTDEDNGSQVVPEYRVKVALSYRF